MAISSQEIIVLIIMALLALIPATVAGNKGYSKVGFWFFGLFLWLIALIVALCLKDKNVSNTDAASALISYQQLLESGAITQEEFEAKKKELMNLKK